MKHGFFINTKLISMTKSILCESFRFERVSTSTLSLFPFPPPILNCCPIQLQLQPANNRPASTHHVNPTTALILLSLTEWQVHGVCSPRQHPRFLTLHLLLYNPRPQSNVTIFIPAVAISKVFTVTNNIHSPVTLLQHTLLHSSLSRPNAAAVAIINVFYSIVSSYLQQFVLIHMGSNGSDAISTIGSTATQAICTWLSYNGRKRQEGIDQHPDGRREHTSSDHMDIFNQHIGFDGWMKSSAKWDTLECCFGYLARRQQERSWEYG
ncbi:predicted protein [Lichtheimia corymbifera JMRC:FSU:9682]|uniref:Uncharacterized protein n=1 Tax=Lichtheimia corymbifera JMRC:FSU:9682 TaxID=1263082 RepID=A0A068S7T3_9FUNG|nr:predicted protein [Lichtheimia corymbifera JMRC:FSU:9682]